MKQQNHNSKINTQMAGSAALLLASLIWGSAFITQTLGMRSMQPYTFQMFRSWIGVLVLLPVIAWLDYRAGRHFWTGWKSPILWKAGIQLGFWVFIAAGLQQVGLLTTTAGKSGFITALYMVLIPIWGLLWGKRLKMAQAVAIALAAAGLALLCLHGDLYFSRGDLYTLLCAFFFAAQILTIDRYCQTVDVVRLSAIQFLGCGLLSAVIAVGFETVTFSGVQAGLGSLLYTGILSTGVAYTLQGVGQKRTSATVASIIMSLEAVFAAVCGWIFLGQAMSGKEIIGGLLMFAAVLLAQWPSEATVTGSLPSTGLVEEAIGEG